MFIFAVCIICHFLTLQISVMKALGKICLAIVIAFAFASCGSEKEVAKQQTAKENDKKQINYLSLFPPYLIPSTVPEECLHSNNEKYVVGRMREYKYITKTDTISTDTLSVMQSGRIYKGNWRTLGHSSSMDSIQSLKEAKSYAYYQLLLEALFDLYPMLFELYDDSFVDDNTIYSHIEHDENNGLYESYVALEIPQEVLKPIIEATIQEQHRYWTKDDYEIYDRLKGETSLITSYGNFSIIQIQNADGSDGQKKIYYKDTEIPCLNDMIKEYKDKNSIPELSKDEMLIWNERKFREYMEKALNEYKEKKQKQDSINN